MDFTHKGDWYHTATVSKDILKSVCETTGRNLAVMASGFSLIHNTIA